MKVNFYSSFEICVCSLYIDNLFSSRGNYWNRMLYRLVQSPRTNINCNISEGVEILFCFPFLSFSSVQFISVAQLCPSLCDPMNHSTPHLPVRHQLLEFTQTHVHWVSDAIKISQSLSPPCFPALNFSQNRVFSSELALHIRWPKYQSFRFRTTPSNEHSVLISFRTDLLDLLAVQGTLKSLLPHHSSKASILQHSAFFMVQLSHLYVTTGKTIGLWLGLSWLDGP